jgi:ribosomal protein L10
MGDLSLTANQVNELAVMLPRNELVAQLLGLLNAPVTRLAYVLNDPVAALARVLQRRIESEETQGS